MSFSSVIFAILIVTGVVAGIEDVYQLAADMGGAGYIFTGEHDAAVMHNSSLINLNALTSASRLGSSGSSIHLQRVSTLSITSSTRTVRIVGGAAYPAGPDSEYGWEKLFSERLYLSYMRNHGVQVRVARFHNIFGPEGTWGGGREKAPAAICRKVAEARRRGNRDMGRWQADPVISLYR